MTDSRRWERLSKLFEEALDQPTAERAAWLENACPDDPELRTEVSRMLSAHLRTGLLDRSIAPLEDEDLQGRLSQALAGRYVIEETLGAGGMATVVLKVLQPGVAARIGAARFLVEVRIAARLSHPHILTLIDSGEVDGLLYYVMPYVAGESLRERLVRDGALTAAEAVGLLRDIADALAHAHAAGVIHRDLKPENILSVGSHAFLLDFGVAKLEADAAMERGTAPGMAVGTPGYMAPEQAAGQVVDHRADLYAWGLLAREILTGSREPVSALSSTGSDVPRSLVALVEACLSIDPQDRPATASSLVAALDGLVVPKRDRGKHPIVAVGIATLLAVVAWLVVRDPVPVERTLHGPIAVAALQDETGDSTLAGWGRLAGDWITQGLHEQGLLPVVPWSAMLLAMAQHDRVPGTDLGQTVRNETEAGLLVTGSYYRVGDSLRFQASIADLNSARLVASTVPVVVSIDSAGVAVRELRGRIMGALAVLLDERIPAQVAMTAQPPTWEAYRIFERGMHEFNRYAYLAAERSFREAWSRDSAFLPSLVYAAFAAVNMGATERGDSLLSAVMAHRSSLSAYHIAIVDYLTAYLHGDRGEALQAILRAARLAPSSRAGYNAAYVLIQLNRAQEADSILGSLNPDRGPMRDWPSYWSQRAYAAHLMGDHVRELGYAREMRTRFPDQRVSWVIEARSLAAMGREESLDSLLVQAETLAPDVFWSQGAMLIIAGHELAAHQRGDSLARFRQAVDWLEERLRHEPGNRQHQSWLSQAFLGLGRWSDAERVLDLLDREGPPRLFHLGQLATLAARRGDTALAVRRLAAAPGATDGEFLLYQARIAALLGEREEAIAKLSTALRRGVYDFHWMQHESRFDFAAIASDPRYRRLMGLPAVSP
jgi:serine/threonine-protein kinase